MQVLNPRDVDRSCSHLEGHSLYKMFFFLSITLIGLLCFCRVCVHANATACIWRSEDRLEESVVSFHCYSPVVLIRVAFSAS